MEHTQLLNRNGYLVVGDLYYWGSLQGVKGVEGKGRDIILYVVQSHKISISGPLCPLYPIRPQGIL